MGTVWIIGCHRGGQPGAVGNGETEVTITDKVLAHTFEILRSDTYKNYNWAQAVDSGVHEWAAITNNVRKGDTIIIPHLNAANSDGAEMYVLANDAASNALANKLQNMTINTLGVRSRGVKNGTDYRSSYYARNLGANGVLMEVCFIDSAGDMNKLKANIAKYGEQLAKIVVEQAGGQWVGVPGVKPPVTPPASDKYKDKIKRNIPADAIGVFKYWTHNADKWDFSTNDLRTINVYKADKIEQTAVDGNNDKITIGTSGARNTFNMQGKKTGYMHQKGRTLNGTYFPK